MNNSPFTEQAPDDVASVVLGSSGRNIAKRGLLNVAENGRSAEDYVKNIGVHPPLRGVLCTRLFFVALVLEGIIETDSMENYDSVLQFLSAKDRIMVSDQTMIGAIDFGGGLD